MTTKEAMEIRRSRRSFLPQPMEAETAAQLQALAADYSQSGAIRIELVLNNGSAFRGLRRSYGMLTGVSNYAGLIAKKNDREAIERLGYYGELLLLHAVALGLGTCWVGGSFDRKQCPFRLSEEELVICTIAMGYAREQESTREQFIRGVTHRKTKRLEEMIVTEGPVPDWFMQGMQAVQTAPSAVNRQPVVFSCKNGTVTADIPNRSDTGALLDLGIAKLHFELGAGKRFFMGKEST